MFWANIYFNHIKLLMSLNTFLQALRIFNTWIGDPSKVILLEAVVKVIKQQNLLSQVNEVGKHLWSGLHDLEVNIAFLQQQNSY